MIWHRIPVYAGIGLNAWVILRLLGLRLHRVYAVFCGFLLFELLSSVMLVVDMATRTPVDYRLLWLGITAPEWILALWTVYELLDAILTKLPGILSFSQRLLKLVFLGSGTLALISVFWLFRSKPVQASAGLVGKIVWYGLSLDRAVGMLALLVLLAILAFVLWFPIQMPRNLVLFVSGIVFYFFIRTGCALGESFLAPKQAAVVYGIALVILPACYLYWGLFITAKGEQTNITLGHGWSVAKHQQLVRDLRSLDTALLRSTQGFPVEPISRQG